MLEIDRRVGSICCYLACQPTPQREFHLFYVLSGAGLIQFEFDSSNDPAFDFDFLCFREETKELVFSQIDLRKREIRHRPVALPSVLVEVHSIMSTQLITFYTQN